MARPTTTSPRKVIKIFPYNIVTLNSESISKQMLFFLARVLSLIFDVMFIGDINDEKRIDNMR